MNDNGMDLMVRNPGNHRQEHLSQRLRGEANNRGGYVAELMFHAADAISHLEQQQARPATTFDMVGAFHKTFGHPAHEEPTVPPLDRIKLRLRLILEEYIELVEAILPKVGEKDSDHPMVISLKSAFERINTIENIDVDLVEVADALGDLDVVTNGTGHEFGLNLNAVAGEVFASNMSKLGEDGKPIYDENGKIQKGPNFWKPDLANLLGLGNQEAPETVHPLGESVDSAPLVPGAEV